MKAYASIVVSRACVRAVSVALVVVGAGCGRPWRPSLETVRTTELAPTFALADYLAHVPGSEWIYERSSIDSSPPADRMEYRRVLTDKAMSEGRLADPTMPALHPILSRKAGPTKKERAVFNALFKDGQACMMAFDPAIPLYPDVLVPGETLQEKTRLRYYDRWGRYGYSGTVTRRVTLEGLETVDTPSGTYTDCLRLHIETEFRLTWGLWADVTDYVWLAEGVGEVRRIERLAGAAWIFFFDATTEYRLIRHVPTKVPPSAPLHALRPCCSALFLERGFPRPIVGGLHHEFAPPSAPTTQPGDDEPIWKPVSPTNVSPETQPSAAGEPEPDRRKSTDPNPTG